MSAPLVDVLARVLHEANEWQYDECDHGVYRGGPRDGEPYAMCELMAPRLAEAVGEWLTSDRTVDAIYSTTRAETARGLYAAVGDVLAALRGYGLGETE